MKPLHLVWFLAGFQPRGWLDPRFGTGYSYASREMYIDSAKSLERACFDGIFVADQPTIDNHLGGSIDRVVASGNESISGDTFALLTTIGAHTRNLGLVGTYSTTYVPPYLLARQLNALDHLTDGRAGWNVVTGARLTDGDAYGTPLPPPEVRYDMADEHVALCRALWESWEADAVVCDRENQIFADPSKVHPIDFSGRYFKSKGVLAFPRSPQGTPVLFQAGASGRGREFAALNAEVIMGNQNSTLGMKSFVDDMRKRSATVGRAPKVFFNLQPVIGETMEEANAKMASLAALSQTRAYVDAGLAFCSLQTGFDFEKLDLDAPILDQIDAGTGNRNAESFFFQYTNDDPRVTPRHMAVREGSKMTLPIVGTAETVADRICEIAEETGANGFLFRESLLPSYIADITDRLVPALQRRGAARTEYSGSTFRDHINEF